MQKAHLVEVSILGNDGKSARLRKLSYLRIAAGRQPDQLHMRRPRKHISETGDKAIWQVLIKKQLQLMPRQPADVRGQLQRQGRPECLLRSVPGIPK